MGNYLVVGGSSGIGLQVVQDLAAQGHRVHATYHQHPIENNGSVSYYPLNVLEETLDLGFLDTPLGLDRGCSQAQVPEVGSSDSQLQAARAWLGMTRSMADA